MSLQQGAKLIFKSMGYQEENLHPQKGLDREIQPAPQNLYWDTNRSTE